MDAWQLEALERDDRNPFQARCIMMSKKLVVLVVNAPGAVLGERAHADEQ